MILVANENKQCRIYNFVHIFPHLNEYNRLFYESWFCLCSLSLFPSLTRSRSLSLFLYYTWHFGICTLNFTLLHVVDIFCIRGSRDVYIFHIMYTSMYTTNSMYNVHVSFHYTIYTLDL